MCSQYVTEKLFNRISLNVVPIVLGKGPYAKMAPPNSFIDAQKFASPKVLADHLWKLDRDPEAYAAHFWWKDRYRVHGTKETHLTMLCQLCEKLNSHLPPKVYADLGYWWATEAGCKHRGQHNWSHY